MQVGADLTSGFFECLLLVLAADAVRRGRRVYWLAVAGMALVLYSRMADGFVASAPRLVLTLAGLVLGAAALLIDILFEVVEEPGPEGGPSV